MKFSPERIKELQKLLKEQFDLNYTDEEAQQADALCLSQRVNKAQKRG